MSEIGFYPLPMVVFIVFLLWAYSFLQGQKKPIPWHAYLLTTIFFLLVVRFFGVFRHTPSIQFQRVVVDTGKAMELVSAKSIQKAIQEEQKTVGNLPILHSHRPSIQDIFITQEAKAPLPKAGKIILLPWEKKPSGLFFAQVPKVCYIQKKCFIQVEGFSTVPSQVQLKTSFTKQNKKVPKGSFKQEFSLTTPSKTGIFVGELQLLESAAPNIHPKISFILSVEKGLPRGKVFYSIYTPFVFTLFRELAQIPIAAISQLENNPDYFIFSDPKAFWQNQALWRQQKKPALLFASEQVAPRGVQVIPTPVVQGWFTKEPTLTQALVHFLRKQSKTQNPLEGGVYFARDEISIQAFRFSGEVFYKKSQEKIPLQKKEDTFILFPPKAGTVQLGPYQIPVNLPRAQLLAFWEAVKKEKPRPKKVVHPSLEARWMHWVLGLPKIGVLNDFSLSWFLLIFTVFLLFWHWYTPKAGFIKKPPP